MSVLATETTLGDVVARHPDAARVLEGFGLDYCCHGEQTLAEACGTAGLAVDDVLSRLDRVAANDVHGDGAPWLALDLPTLVDHIVEVHHRYLHEELPRVDALSEKVLCVHGDGHEELTEVRRLVAELRADLEPHLAKEERVLFPAIRAIAQGRHDFPFGSVVHPIRMLTAEHEQAGELLSQLRQVTDGYAVPGDGCASYRSLYERLEALEIDTHLHIHKENHTLFPAAIARFRRQGGEP